MSDIKLLKASGVAAVAEHLPIDDAMVAGNTVEEDEDDGQRRNQGSDEDVPGVVDTTDFECQPCDSTEFLPMRRAAIPIKPASESEIEDHRKCHLPYRSWCRECVMGRGLGEQRGAHQGRAHEIPRVGVDYWFITSKGLTKKDELEYEQSSSRSPATRRWRGIARPALW